jgi:hypothetical protein
MNEAATNAEDSREENKVRQQKMQSTLPAPGATSVPVMILAALNPQTKPLLPKATPTSVDCSGIA